MLTRKILLAAAIAASWLPMTASADDAFEEAVRKCSAITDESARLICFDAVSTAKPGVAAKPEAVAEPPAAATKTAPAKATPEPPANVSLAEQSADIEVATGAAAAASVAREVEAAEAADDVAATEAAEEVQPLTDDVGMERVDPSAAKNPEYVARVVRCDKHQQSGQIYFFLDNDQVWKQANYRRMSLGKCDFEVRLKKDAFGYELTIPSKDRTVRVSRIR